MIYILFDTNLLYYPNNDKIYFIQTTPKFRNFLDKINRIDTAKFCISRISMLELREQQKNKLKKIVTSARQISEYLPHKEESDDLLKVSCLTLKLNYTENDKEVFLDKINEIINNAFETFSKLKNIEVLEHDEIDFNIIIDKAIEHKKPFSEKSDNGFKDALILESAIYFIKNREDDKLIFFTKDSDFSDLKNLPNNLEIKILLKDKKINEIMENWEDFKREYLK